MSAKQTGLGRNLSALLSQPVAIRLDAAPLTQGQDGSRQMLPMSQLQPGKYQPRKDMDDLALTELAQSIQQQGLLQPIVVREISPDTYEIIAGERRFRACQLNGMTAMPVIIRQVDDATAMVLALVENLQREDLNAVDEARAMQTLHSEFALTHQAIADILSKSRAHVSNSLRLLNLHPEVLRLLEHGDLDMGHARSLLSLKQDRQYEVAKQVIAGAFSVRETEQIVAKLQAGKVKQAPPTKQQLAPLLMQQLDLLAQQWQKKVAVKPGKAHQGTLMIPYCDAQDLANMLTRLMEVCP